MGIKPPHRIFLQWYCEEHDSMWGDPSPGDVTWCPDPVFSDDLEYVLVSKPEQERELDE